jgi:phosphopantetheine--protein transferase-like protein
MHIVGVGTDIVELRRIREARYILRAADFFFVPEELDALHDARDTVQFVASRLAAKEAVIKAYPGTLHYHDIIIDREGRKLVARLVRPEDHIYKVFVSIAHEFNYAVSYATICL